MFNLSQLDSKAGGEKGSILKLTHPDPKKEGEILFADDEKKKPFSIGLYGSDADVYKRRVKAVQEDIRESGVDMSQVDLEHELLIAGTYSVNNIVVDADGKMAKLADIGAVYKQYPWMAEQARAYTVNRGNFMQG